MEVIEGVDDEEAGVGVVDEPVVQAIQEGALVCGGGCPLVGPEEGVGYRAVAEEFTGASSDTTGRVL